MPVNILISNCEFLHAGAAIQGVFSNCVIQGSTFIQWDSNCFFTGAVNTSPSTQNTVGYFGNVSVFVAGYNIVVLNNAYYGNTTLL